MYEIIERVFDFIEIMNSQVSERSTPVRGPPGPPGRHERRVFQFLNQFEAQVSGFTRSKRVSVKAICFS